MGIGRPVVEGFDPAVRPRVGELTATRTSVLVGVKGGYVDVGKLEARLSAVEKVVTDPAFVAMLAWFRAARARLNAAGYGDDELKDLIF